MVFWNKLFKKRGKGQILEIVAIVGAVLVLGTMVVLIALPFAYFGGTGVPGGGTGGGPTGGVTGVVPPQYAQVFQAAGSKFQVQPAFLAAIFKAGEHQDQSYHYNPSSSWPEFRDRWSETSPAGAQGPFQFMPGTWAGHAQDGNGDGIKDILGIWDSAFGAAHLLSNTGAGGNSTSVDSLRDAASRYNSGRPWSQGQNIQETARYVPRVIEAFTAFFAQGQQP